MRSLSPLALHNAFRASLSKGSDTDCGQKIDLRYLEDASRQVSLVSRPWDQTLEL